MLENHALPMPPISGRYIDGCCGCVYVSQGNWQRVMGAYMVASVACICVAVMYVYARNTLQECACVYMGLGACVCVCMCVHVCTYVTFRARVVE